MTFKELGIKKEFIEGLNELGILIPSEIQKTNHSNFISR